MEFLNDSLWKVSRNGIDCNIVCPFTEKPISMKKMIDSMLQYIYPSLLYFNTDYVVKTVKDILNTSTEADIQIDIYNKFGFEGLKKHLIDKVGYSF